MTVETKLAHIDAKIADRICTREWELEAAEAKLKK